MHWQGKLRGIEFAPTLYKIETTGSPDVLDSKGRQVVLPYLMQSTAETDEARASVDVDTSVALLRAMLAMPKGTQQQWAADIGKSKALVGKKLPHLKHEKLVDQVLGRWSVTPKGEKETEKWA